MASVPPEPPAPPHIPDIIEQALDGGGPAFEPAPTPDSRGEMTPLDPADVRTIPEPDPELPAPPDDAPTHEDMDRERERLMEPTEVVRNDTVQGGPDLSVDVDSGSDADHRADGGQDVDVDHDDHDAGDHDGGDHDGGEHDGGDTD